MDLLLKVRQSFTWHVHTWGPAPGLLLLDQTLYLHTDISEIFDPANCCSHLAMPSVEVYSVKTLPSRPLQALN